MKTKNVHQTVTLKADPKDVYHALMNSDIQSKITGSKAVIGSKTGSPFSVWDGGINGFNLALDKNKKIVQAWRAEEWPKGHYSVAVFDLEKTESGTKLVFDQYGVPDDDCKNISDGWKSYYWNSMKSMFKTVHH
jgi:activator of HSP90 ATPase